MGLDNVTDLIQLVLTRGGEIDAGGTAADSPFFGIMDEILSEVWRDLITRHAFLPLSSDPPGVFLTANDITTLTVQVPTTGTSVAATLSDSPNVNLAGYKLRPNTKTWSARITAHAAPTAGLSITLDAAPEVLAAGTACTIFQDEYDLATDLGVFINGLWDQSGTFVPLTDLETMVAAYPDPPGGATTAERFARLTTRKIRLSHYPTSIRRYEYPYIAQAATDPTGSTTLTIPAELRPVLAEGMLALLYERKSDARRTEAVARFEMGITRAINYDARRRTGYGLLNKLPGAGGYGDRRWGR
mgnify:CR=1 FL=1